MTEAQKLANMKWTMCMIKNRKVQVTFISLLAFDKAFLCPLVNLSPTFLKAFLWVVTTFYS